MERLRWRVLRSFGALPTEERVKAMKNRDYLYCALHLLLDDEEEEALLCPSCRAEAERGLCPVCGGERGMVQTGENEAFDMERFLKMKGEVSDD